MTMAAAAVPYTRLGGGCSAWSRTRIKPPVQTHKDAAISRPLGLTADPKISTVGVAATATVSTRSRDLLHTEDSAKARPTMRAVSNPLRRRIR